MNDYPSSGSSASITFTEKSTRLLNARKVSQSNREAFQAILEKTNSTLTTQNAKEVLSALSAQEREVLRVVHSLADPIQVSQLDKEGAYNLLCQPGQAKDLNNDGFLRIGAGLIYTFPPPNAPESVQQAWEKVTAGKSDRDKMLLQMIFAPLEVSANLRYNAQGQVTGIISPTEAGYTNIYAQPGFSYTGLVDKYLEYLDNVKVYMTSSEYQARQTFMNDFKQALNGA